MHNPVDRIAHATAFVTPVVENWLEREIAQWVHPMKDRSDDQSNHERTLIPRSYISLPVPLNSVLFKPGLFWLGLTWFDVCIYIRWSSGGRSNPGVEFYLRHPGESVEQEVAGSGHCVPRTGHALLCATGYQSGQCSLVLCNQFHAFTSNGIFIYFLLYIFYYLLFI